MTERLKELRKHLRLTQQEFANKLGISRNTFASYEAGNNSPSDAVVKLICKEFHVNEDWLRTGEGEMFLQMDPEDELMEWAGRVLAAHPHDFRKRFVKMLMGLSDEQWHIMEAKILELAAQYDDEDNKKED